MRESSSVWILVGTFSGLLLLLAALLVWGFFKLSEWHRSEVASSEQARAHLTSLVLEQLNAARRDFEADCRLPREGESPEHVTGWLLDGRVYMPEAAPTFHVDFLDRPAPSLLAQLQDRRVSPGGLPLDLVAAVALAEGLPREMAPTWQALMAELWQGSHRLPAAQHLVLLEALPNALAPLFATQRSLLRSWLFQEEIAGLIRREDGVLNYRFTPAFLQRAQEIGSQFGATVSFNGVQPQITIQNLNWIRARQQRELALWFGVCGLTLLLLGALVFSIRSLVQLNVHRQRLVHTVSHEFRTPLAAILQFSEMLIDGRYKTQERAQAYFSQIHAQGTRLQRLVENMLTFARIEKRVFRLKPVPQQPDVYLNQVLAQVVPDPQNTPQLESKTTVDIQIDPEALQMVISNLLSNAFKYGRPPYQLRSFDQGDDWVLEVCDAGPGLQGPDKEAQKVFRPYARQDSDKEGLGLGLHLCQTIVRAHGGVITYLRRDQTTVFRIQLPRGKS